VVAFFPLPVDVQAATFEAVPFRIDINVSGRSSQAAIGNHRRYPKSAASAADPFKFLATELPSCGIVEPC
jgi:hypothetical protein